MIYYRFNTYCAKFRQCSWRLPPIWSNKLYETLTASYLKSFLFHPNQLSMTTKNFKMMSQWTKTYVPVAKQTTFVHYGTELFIVKKHHSTIQTKFWNKWRRVFFSFSKLETIAASKSILQYDINTTISWAQPIVSSEYFSKIFIFLGVRLYLIFMEGSVVKKRRDAITNFFYVTQPNLRH